MNTLKFSHVLFDFDGTLVDSLHANHRIICKIFSECGLPSPTFVDFRDNFRTPYLGYYQQRGISLSNSELQARFNQLEDFEILNFFDDSLRTLATLRDNCVVMGVISARPVKGIDHHFIKHAIREDFAFIEAGHELKTPPILAYCGQAGVLPSGVCYVGDAPSDMEHAVAAGVFPIGITRGIISADILRQAGARHCVDHLSELPEFLGIHSTVR